MLRRAALRARGLKIGYEALAWGRHVRDHRDAWMLVQAADHPNTGIILDSFHSLARGIPSLSLLSIDPANVRNMTMPSAIGKVGPADVVFPGAGAQEVFADFRDDGILQSH